jgi:Flp pilus assembly protein TadG
VPVSCATRPDEQRSERMTRLARKLRRRDERGASAVEFALIVPVVVMLLLGTITTGLVYSDHLSVTNAVREGARYGSVADATNGTTWANSVQTRVQQVYFNAAGTQPTDNEICVQLVQKGGTVLASDSGSACGTAPGLPSNMADGSCVVLVWMQEPETIQLVVFPSLNVDIGARSVAYYGRTVGTTCTAS